MTRCLHFKCLRDDLARAPGFPTLANIPVAHVNDKGEPCPESPYDVYDLETKQLVVSEDKMWDIGVTVKDEPDSAAHRDDAIYPKSDIARAISVPAAMLGSAETIGSKPAVKRPKRKIEKKAAAPAAKKAADDDSVDDWHPGT